MSNIGLRRGKVKLEPHNDGWSKSYQTEKQQLTKTLGHVQIEHVGSTAIPGMKAKPIIDIAIPLLDLENVTKWIKPLESIGYWDKGKQDEMPERRFFAKGPETERTVYLHVVTQAEFDRMTRFRDTLINNMDLRNQYSEIKEDLADKFPNNRQRYTKGKEQFIQYVLSKAKF
ncbi:MAG: GrpB family protein [Candidatus Saccharimonadia bacterium]